jgi:phosphatidylinositol glycan class C protein
MGIALAGGSAKGNHARADGKGDVGLQGVDWRAACMGVGLWGVGTGIGMGVCSWWLIGLQKYKNVVIGPWDPARPIIRQGGGWD